jgi:RHS repeat-associated protein
MSGSGYTMSYDEDGNLISKSGPGLSQTLSWNSLGQLTSVTTNGTTVTFGYDGLGRRVRKTVNGTAIGYLYTGADLYMEVDGSGNPVTEYAYWPSVDAPFAMSKGGQTYYFTQDPTAKNITSLIRASDNSVQAAYYYTPFGTQRSGGFDYVGNSLQFAGRQYDSETGLLYFRARYYDPQFGRFVSEDPIGLNGGINPYVYASNDPINGSDPFGLDGCEDGQGVCVDGGTITADPGCDETCIASILSGLSNIGGNGGGYGGGYGGGGGGGAGPGNPAPAPKPPKRSILCRAASGTDNIQVAGQRLRTPDFYSININVAIPTPWTGSYLGWSGTVSISRYGDVYWSALGGGIGKSATGVSGSVTANWMNQRATPSADQLKNMLSAFGANFTAGYWLGASESYTPGAGTATGVGFVSPQIGVSGNYSFHAGNVCGQ